MPSLEKMAKEAKTKTVSSVKPTKSAKKASSPVPYKSLEFVQETDEEDEDQAAEQSSDDDSLPENPADSLNQIEGELPPPAGSSSSSENGTIEDEEGEDSNEEHEKKNNESDNSGEPIEAMETPAKKLKTSKSTTDSISSQPYNPPIGFQAGNIRDNSNAENLFKKSNLAGKQIWYFTAPADVPVSSITRMSLQDAKNGNIVFSHKDSDWGFVLDPAAVADTKIIVPNSSGDEYRISSRKIDQVLHLQQIVRLRGTAIPEAHSTNTIPTHSLPRPQPKGLKMRFPPIGYGNSNLGDQDNASDDEMAESSAFRKPLRVDEDMTEAPPMSTKHVSKPKKDKKEKKERKEIKASVNGSLKRKHGEGKEKKSKSSSS